jgi:predicted nucleic acid-binding protein
MKPTLYIETSVISYLTSRLRPDPIVAGQMLETRKWWAESRFAFELFTSELVLEEASRGDPTAAAERLEALADLALTPVGDATTQLAEALVLGHALPEKARVDALHLAICAINQINFLATWNCRHLANATLREKIEHVCRQGGYNSPIICTPAQLSEVRP